ncbi:uncharacterized protein LAESUDRAFT_75264 [Laetiporus sulphureus 93-53]|uniref:Uncharacterized protein n=1 Tax=Laetiporus sulphureus 93-53 TaxID=1314785 RepID=A0A165F0D9_9APHY|nr:uncharacterized protein LAESUDRAFT_75264 [Laetiporus sulphureus 93-53]KZT08097.1 hypothetical protein LAESUDRAFT_75264 [Laetiporus sulphureus 93-53]
MARCDSLLLFPCNIASSQESIRMASSYSLPSASLLESPWCWIYRASSKSSVHTLSSTSSRGLHLCSSHGSLPVPVDTHSLLQQKPAMSSYPYRQSVHERRNGEEYFSMLPPMSTEEDLLLEEVVGSPIEVSTPAWEGGSHPRRRKRVTAAVANLFSVSYFHHV